MIGTKNNKRLTNTSLADILFPLAQHVLVWFGSHKKHKMPIARLIRRLRFHMQKIIYGGRYLGSFGSHGSCAMSTNLDNVHRHKFGSFKRCPQTTQEVITMSQNNSAQNSEQINTQVQTEQNQTLNFDVTFFVISNKTTTENCTYTDFISPFFETRAQALEFKAQSLAEYPECFSGRYTAEYSAEDDRDRKELLAKIVRAKPESQLLDQLQQSIDDAKSDFVIELTTNEFSPRAKVGQRLAMRTGCLAEDGGLVAVKLGDKYRVDWYNPDSEYCAVCVAIMAKRLTQQAEQTDNIQVTESEHQWLLDSQSNDVRYFFVTVKKPRDDGSIIVNLPISPYFRTREESESFLQNCGIDGAYISGGVTYPNDEDGKRSDEEMFFGSDTQPAMTSAFCYWIEKPNA